MSFSKYKNLFFKGSNRNLITLDFVKIDLNRTFT